MNEQDELNEGQQAVEDMVVGEGLDPNIAFGNLLRSVRTLAGLSLQQVADRCNLSRTYLSKIELGRVPPPSSKSLKALADALSVDEDEFLTYTSPRIVIRTLKARIAQLESELAELRGEPKKQEVDF